MKYRGLEAQIEFDADDQIYVGRLLGTEDIVSFHAESPVTLGAAFQEAVNDYLDTLAKLNRS